MVNPNLYKALKGLAFTYDSSVHPAVLPGRYLDFLQSGSIRSVEGITEVPMSTFLGLPISWWWMRNVGVEYTRLGCQASMRMHGYALLYFHPWEFAKLPKVEGLPGHMTKGTGKKALEDLERLIRGLSERGCMFQTVEEIAASRR